MLWLAAEYSALALGTNELGPQHQLELFTQRGYLPSIPVLVRVELHNATGRERDLWDANAALSTDQSGVSLSTNRVLLRNGLGSALVTFTGGADFTLTARVGALQISRQLVSMTNSPVVSIGGTLSGSNVVWSGIIRVTNDVIVTTGTSLTILSNTLVLIDGTASGTNGNDLVINGGIESLGTEDRPVTITCGSTNGSFRWGQIRHNSSQASLYRYTTITRAGRGIGEGHTSTTPVIRPTSCSIRFESCNITDHAETTMGTAGFGGPGKVGLANGANLTFIDCLFQRCRMGPEISGTALACTNTWMMDMGGPDDADGIYLHDQAAGQIVALSGCVIARGDDDGIDTLGSRITVEDCIIRDWNSVIEDAKAISVFNGETEVHRCLIVNSTVGIAAKWSSGPAALVVIQSSTLADNLTNVWANRKANAPGPFVDFRITNSVLWGGDSVQSDFGVTNFTIGYCDISESWPGTANINIDPRFVSATNHDYHLQPYSACIDAGGLLDAGDPNALPDPDGSRPDLGVFRFIPPAPVLKAPEVVAGAGIRFVLNAYSNRNYVIESADALTNWTFLKTVIQSSETNVVTDTTATNALRRFYRARLAPYHR